MLVDGIEVEDENEDQLDNNALSLFFDDIDGNPDDVAAPPLVKQGDGLQNVEDVEDDDDKSIDPSTLFDLEEPSEEDVARIKKEEQAPVTKNNNVIKAFAKELIDENILDIDDAELDKIESVDDIKEALKETVSKREFANLNDNQKEYLELLKAGVPDQVVQQFQININTLKDINEASLENDLELAEELYSIDLKQKGFSEAKIKTYVDRAKEKGVLVEEALDSRDSLIETETKNITAQKEAGLKKQEADKKKHQEKITSLKTALSKEYEVFKGVKLTKVESEKVLNSIFNPSFKDENGNKIDIIKKYSSENPVDFTIRLHYLLLNGFFDKGFDIATKVSGVKQVASKKVNDFEKLLMKEQNKSNVGRGANANASVEKSVNSLVAAINSL
jgi:hypothetical protein